MKDKKLKKLLSDLQVELQSLLGEKLVKVILYGSYANKTFDEESDVDIMVLTNLSDEENKILHSDVTDIIVELSLKYDMLLSVILKSVKQFNLYLPILPFYKNVLEKGITLYG